MKDQILKIAKAKNEADFYKKFPTEEAFMAKHGAALKKAAMGTSMVKKQLTQLTDWSNPPKALDGGNWASAGVPGLSTATYDKSTGLVNNASGSVSKSDTQALGFADKAPGASSSAFDADTAGMAGLQGIGKVFSGIDAIGKQTQNIHKAEAQAKISDVVAQASESRPIGVEKHKYVRPEDALLTGMNPTGVAANGAEIQNTYAPNNIYTNLGYEPLDDSNKKQFKKGGKLPKAELGDYTSGNSGQAQVAGSVGSAIAAGFGLPPQLGELAGNIVGNLLGGADDANRLARANTHIQENTQRAAMQQGIQGLQSQYHGSLKDGGTLSDQEGWMNPNYNPQLITKFGDMDITDVHNFAHQGMDTLRAGGHLKEYTPPSARAMQTYDDGGYMAMGGDLQVHRGEAETISHNPYLPDGGETVMFRGPSHANGGMPISFGQNGVEVQGGEPAVKLQDGGSPEGTNLTVFGGMQVSKDVANAVGLKDAVGKKYQTVAAKLSKVEARQNKINEKAADLAANSDEHDPFSQLSLASAKANIMGANMKLKQIAEQKEDLGRWQNAILDHAEENGLVSDELAKGKIKKAKLGTKLSKAQVGDQLPRYAEGLPNLEDYNAINTLPDVTVSANRNFVDETGGGLPNSPVGRQLPTFDQPGFGSKAWDTLKTAGKATGNFLGKQADKYGNTILSNIAPFLRPTNQFPLDPSELSGEMLALASNQLEPVQAQTFQPRLKQAYNVSLQDQLNEVDQQSRAALRQIGNNPSAAATIAAQAAEAKNKIRGQQLQMNMAQQIGTANENTVTLNDAQLKNLSIYDQQYQRQSEAKSKTKAQAIGALQSIAEKVARNKQENMMAAIEQQRYNYRFSPSGVAYNANDPYQFRVNPTGTGSTSAGSIGNAQGVARDSSGRPMVPIYNKSFQITGYKEEVPAETQYSTKKDGGKVKARNGAIVKALKNL